MLRKNVKNKKNKRNKRLGKPIQYDRFIRALGLVCLLAVMNLGCIMIYDVLIQWNYFNATKIQVEGNQRLSRDQVINQAHIEIGQNILSMNLNVLRKNLLSHPWIAQAEIYREIPGTISICIEEYKPLAIIDIGQKFLLDHNGHIFKRVEGPDPRNLPVITGLNICDVDPQKPSQSSAYKAAFKVLQMGMASACLLNNQTIKEIKVDRDIGLTLYAFEKPVVIKIGFSNYTLKFAHFQEIWNYLIRNNRIAQVDSIDLKDINRVVIRGFAPDNGKEV